MNQAYHKPNSFGSQQYAPAYEPYRPPYTPPPQQYGPVWSNTPYNEPRNHPFHAPPQQRAHFQQPQTIQSSYQQHVAQNQKHQPQTKKEEEKNTHSVFNRITNEWYKTWYFTWIKEELNFTMNKISMAGLLFGLMFLGSIFFLIGFLVAVNMYGGKPVTFQAQQHPRSLLPSHSAQLSGRIGHPMNAQYQPSGFRQHPSSFSHNGNARTPSSFQQQGQIAVENTKPRMPSFQNTGSGYVSSSFQNTNGYQR